MKTTEQKLQELRKRREAALLGGGEERIKKIHDAGRLTARERINVLFDPGTFQELGVFGAETSFWNSNFMNLSGILNDKTNTLGVMLRALFGYQDKPTPVELISYLLYWVVITLTYFQVNISIKKSRVTEIAA